eukprot:CAMPEP_0181235738 /NCGR_PEP_ID=MMETSP1096-20121128/37752_1 /TAXON_ID=156174 ORGANISM="Chrysochromulina ericina, Strain CCMP281" /NCGR_SAMPLE_ID=MMETSP1096 /ASSEMBLY_ACC=CAM_ASM_000453 /LENGTH=61 /DNA_ID=CAMNT_0023330771 /DNA_START=16 /DNA_END=201 /DNA_ORIENTATION=-
MACAGWGDVVAALPTWSSHSRQSRVSCLRRQPMDVSRLRGSVTTRAVKHSRKCAWRLHSDA